MDEIETFLTRTSIAYISMEIAFQPDIPTYAGGLGILAGDAARSAADLGLPMVFVTLASRGGYLRQTLDSAGRQMEAAEPWSPADYATALPAMAGVPMEGRIVWVRPWLHILRSGAGGTVPVLLLDTDVTENDPRDRGLTAPLYGGDSRFRLCQEIVLGLGAERVLAALGFRISTYHLNEGHAALLPLALLRRRPLRLNQTHAAIPYDLEYVLERCVFTTHTPVEAGHDRFSYELVREVLGDFIELDVLKRLGGDDALNMTRLALNLSGYENGVAQRHRRTAEGMFPGYPIRSITNGVHPETWVHQAFAELYNGIAPNWKIEPELLARADGLPAEALRTARARAKIEMLEMIRSRTGVQLDPDRPILIFARRMTAYKRPTLILQNPGRLRSIAHTFPFQIVFSGKAHPQDENGKQLIADIIEAGRALGASVPVAFLPGYNFATARSLVAGADLWINTPVPPMEASGTSGMKAALNGVPSLSVLDGWWEEGCVEGVTGWAVGASGDRPETHGTLLLDKLEGSVLPLFHRDPEGWGRLMGNVIAKAGSIFTSHRMMRRYASEAYLGCDGHAAG